MWPARNVFRFVAAFMTHAFPQVLVSYAKLVLAPVLLYSDRVVPASGNFWIVYTLGVLLLGVWLWTRSGALAFLLSYSWVVDRLFCRPRIVMVSKSLMHDHWAYPALPGFYCPSALESPIFERGRCLFGRFPKIGAKVLMGILLLISWGDLGPLAYSLARNGRVFFWLVGAFFSFRGDAGQF